MHIALIYNVLSKADAQTQNSFMQSNVTTTLASSKIKSKDPKNNSTQGHEKSSPRNNNKSNHENKLQVINDELPTDLLVWMLQCVKQIKETLENCDKIDNILTKDEDLTYYRLKEIKRNQEIYFKKEKSSSNTISDDISMTDESSVVSLKIIKPPTKGRTGRRRGRGKVSTTTRRGRYAKTQSKSRGRGKTTQTQAQTQAKKDGSNEEISSDKKEDYIWEIMEKIDIKFNEIETENIKQENNMKNKIKCEERMFLFNENRECNYWWCHIMLDLLLTTITFQITSDTSIISKLPLTVIDTSINPKNQSKLNQSIDTEERELRGLFFFVV